MPIIELIRNNIVGIIMTAITIIVAIVIYRRSQRKKVPTWAFRTTTLIEGYSSHLTDLQVTYKGRIVENLSVSRFALWNAGAETLSGTDIAAANPLSLRVIEPQAVILDARLIATNNASSMPTIAVSPDGQRAPLAFDYLDRDQGAVFQLVHTGTSSRALSLAGDLKGVKALSKRDIRVFHDLPLPSRLAFDRHLSPSMKRRVRAAIMIFLGFAFLGFAAFTILGLKVLLPVIMHPRTPYEFVCLQYICPCDSLLPGDDDSWGPNVGNAPPSRNSRHSKPTCQDESNLSHRAISPHSLADNATNSGVEIASKTPSSQ